MNPLWLLLIVPVVFVAGIVVCIVGIFLLSGFDPGPDVPCDHDGRLASEE